MALTFRSRLESTPENVFLIAALGTVVVVDKILLGAFGAPKTRTKRVALFLIFVIALVGAFSLSSLVE